MGVCQEQWVLRSFARFLHFAEMSALLGPPPKIIWLRCGNQPTAVIEKLLRSHAADVLAQFDKDLASACIEIY